MQSILWKAL